MAKQITALSVIFMLVLISGCAQKMLNPQQSWDEGQYEVLVAKGQDYLLANPDDDKSRILIGKAGFVTGDSLFAINTLKPIALKLQKIKLIDAIVAAAISNGELYYARDVLAQKMSRFGETQATKDKLATVESMIHQATYAANNGFKMFEKEEWVKAVKYYREALGLHKTEKEIKSFFLLSQAEVLIKNALSSKGEAILKKIAESKELTPDSPYAWYVEGDYYFQTGNKEKATKSFQVAMDKGLKGRFAVQAKGFLK